MATATSSEPTDRAQAARRSADPRYDFHVLVDGRELANIGVCSANQDERSHMERALEAVPDELFERAATISLRNAFWDTTVPVMGRSREQVVCHGARLMGMFTALDMRRDMQRSPWYQGHAPVLSKRRCGARARGAGRPRGRRTKTRSAAPPSSDDGPGEPPPAGGRSRRSTLLELAQAQLHTHFEHRPSFDGDEKSIAFSRHDRTTSTTAAGKARWAPDARRRSVDTREGVNA